MQVFSVTQVVNSIKKYVEIHYRDIILEAEVNSLMRSGQDHLYFQLMDTESSLSAVIFRTDCVRNPDSALVKNGDSVYVKGQLSLFPKKGTLQLVVKLLAVKGKGPVLQQMEITKAKLSQEGLFDLDKKRKIPAFPRRIILLTALRGAALKDFLTVYQRRSFFMNILIIPCLVQGEAAPLSIVQGFDRLRFFYENQDQGDFSSDVVVMTRGGGGQEDLWCFHHESIIRAMRSCFLPVISAIGHEKDYTLSDYASDYRAETPTAAAEILTENQTKLSFRFKHSSEKLLSAMDKKFHIRQKKILTYNPKVILSLLMRKIYERKKFVEKALFLLKRGEEIIKIYQRKYLLDDFYQRLHKVMVQIQQRQESRLEGINIFLKGYNPEYIFERGFVYLYQYPSLVISDTKVFDQLKDSSTINVKFIDGERKVWKDKEEDHKEKNI
jgi:exodeoxyribonuclease VII large subunit